MVEDMQMHYLQQRYSHMSPASIQEGGLYAALHHDDYWYRYVVSFYLVGYLQLLLLVFCQLLNSVAPVNTAV
jgi:hypothetical protein